MFPSLVIRVLVFTRTDQDKFTSDGLAMFQPLKCHSLSQDFRSSLGRVQELNREAGQLSHGASEETTGAYKRGSEVRGRAGQSTQKGKAMKNWGKLWVVFLFNWVLVSIQPWLFYDSLKILNVKFCLNTSSWTKTLPKWNTLLQHLLNIQFVGFSIYWEKCKMMYRIIFSSVYIHLKLRIAVYSSPAGTIQTLTLERAFTVLGGQC